MIIQMIIGEAQLFNCALARLRGNRVSEKPAIISSSPTTVYISNMRVNGWIKPYHRTQETSMLHSAQGSHQASFCEQLPSSELCGS
jgi:hypothetical protein